MSGFIMGNSEDFKLHTIISESSEKLREVSEDAYNHLIDSSNNALIGRLTPSRSRKLARELIAKLGIEVGE